MSWQEAMMGAAGTVSVVSSSVEASSSTAFGASLTQATVTVTLNDGRQFPARVLATNLYPDLALLKIAVCVLTYSTSS